MGTPRRQAGFSLVELVMIVVIVGILASVAIPMHRAYQLRSKSAEAATNIAGIQLAEQAYYTESGLFLDIPPHPAAIPGTRPVPFNRAAPGFDEIGFAPEGNVYFSYGVAISADGLGFTADAGGDLDGNGIVQFWGYTRADGAGAIVPGKVGCNAAALVPQQISACDPSHGRSVF